MKVYITGIGMDGEKTLTTEALQKIKSSELLIGAERMTKPFLYLGKPVYNEYNPQKIAEYIKNTDFETIAVLMSGDCGFFSGAKGLSELLKDVETSIICGISTPVYLCSKLGMDWHNMKFLSLHGRSENIVRNVCTHEKTFFLLGGKITPAEVCKKLCEYGFDGLTVHIGENLAYDDEKIFSGTARNFTDCNAPLSAMIVENPDYEKYVLSGIPDCQFIRGKVPMTKSEIRNIAVSALKICKKSTCWDIGSGTGSVAVEMAMKCTDGIVYAVEKKIEAVELIKQNSLKFKCDNIKLIHSEAIDIIESLPPPNSVFIGGSGGHLEKILKTAVEKNPDVKIVTTAVSIETLTESMRISKLLGLKFEISQVAITRTVKIGSHTMFSAENPIFIIRRTFD